MTCIRYTRSERPVTSKKVSKLSVSQPGGLTIIHYLGFNELADYRGLSTGIIYRFGLERLKGYVDVKDIPSLLEIVEDGQWVFELWQEVE
ncbi:MAG: hypothetical protein WC373_14555 [Smithella sp.]|jgi:hypothetical protein